jgi:hypothetical protein
MMETGVVGEDALSASSSVNVSTEQYSSVGALNFFPRLALYGIVGGSGACFLRRWEL